MHGCTDPDQQRYCKVFAAMVIMAVSWRDRHTGKCIIPAERGQVENASICNHWQLQVWSRGSLRWGALGCCAWERLGWIKQRAPTASCQFSGWLKICRIGRGCRRYCRCDPIWTDLVLMPMTMLELLHGGVLCLLCMSRKEGIARLVFGWSVISQYLEQASLSLLRHSKLALICLGTTEKINKVWLPHVDHHHKAVYISAVIYQRYAHDNS